MDHDPLNFFSPFDHLEPNHENQLTRALLVVLSLSPMAHTVWLRLVAPERELQQLPPADYTTQRRAIREAEDGDDPADLVSVFLAPEKPLTGGGIVTESDRGQVLDAIIDYGGELLVVVENKVAEAEAWQATELNTTGAHVKIAPDQEAVVVLWRDVLEAFAALRERGLVSGAEDGVLDQFLTYVEDQFPVLGPFRTLKLCHGNPLRQTRRLRQVLSEAIGTEATIDGWGPNVPTPGGKLIGANAYLILKEGGVQLQLFPADTLTQARAFYTNTAAVDGLLALAAQPGWEAGSNFHFGHFQRGYCWTCNETDVEHYIKTWRKEIFDAGPIPEEEWPEYWEWLEKEQTACADDWPEFERHFVNTDRTTATPRPGLWLARHSDYEEAEALDGKGVLAHQVRGALNEALTAVGEPTLAAVGEAVIA